MQIIILGCRTVSGPAINKRCAFPIRYRGLEYNECISIVPRGPFLCATSNSGTLEDDKHGNCSSACPVNGKKVELSS